MLKRIVVGDNERALLTSQGRFERMLEPGVHWMWSLGRDIGVELHNVQGRVFSSQWAEFLMNKRPDVIERYFELVETGDREVAVVSWDGKVDGVVRPGQKVLYWRDAGAVTFERFDVVEEPVIPVRLTAPLLRLGHQAPTVFPQVDDGKRGLVYIDGRLVRELGPGMYGFWTAVTAPKVEIVELRRQTLEVNGQEILTRDKVSVRVNVSAVYEVVDAAAVKAGVADAREHLYRSVQIAVRQSLGKRTLEEMLAEKTDLDAAVAVEVRQEMEPLGVRVGVIALKDVVLPGDVREILNQVVTAEKQAQANVIRRREEVASTRSLLNTAKMMAENPILVRLKELEALEKISEKIDRFTVIGGPQALLDGSFRIVE